MKNLLKLMFLGAILALPAAEAFAGAVTSVRKSLTRTRDDSGNPIQIESDRAWKVFELANNTNETQVTDESGVAPTGGVLHKVCVESASGATLAATDWAIVWDSAAITGTNATSRRLLPPLMRASAAVRCSDVLDAMFTRGLRALNGNGGVGSTYIYWRELGAYR